MTEVRIRPMTVEDVDGVLVIENCSFSLPWSRNAFETEMVDNDLAHYLVAELSDQIIAYAGMWMIFDESHVTNVAVLPEYRNQGVGKYIMASLILYAKQQGAKRMTLEVRQSNEAAKQLYGQFGFVEAGLRKNYYTDSNEDAIIMWLDIK